MSNFLPIALSESEVTALQQRWESLYHGIREPERMMLPKSLIGEPSSNYSGTYVELEQFKRRLGLFYGVTGGSKPSGAIRA